MHLKIFEKAHAFKNMKNMHLKMYDEKGICIQNMSKTCILKCI